MKKIFSLSLLLAIILHCSGCFGAAGKKNAIFGKTTKIEKTKEQQEEKKQKWSKFKKFVKEYIATKESPVFRDKKHVIGIQYGYDYDRLHYKDDIGRNLHVGSLQYSVPFKMFYLHARLTFGAFILAGKDKAAVNENEGKYHHFGLEFLQELILGNKFLYATGGFGFSYVIFGGPMTYRSYHQAESSGIPDSAHGYDGMTYFNYVLRASIGHSFDNGLSVELMWKHYSNGGLGEVNYDINAFGITLNYAFNIT